MKSLKDEILNLLGNDDFQKLLEHLFEESENKFKFYESLFLIIEKERSLDLVERAIRFLSVIRPIPFAYEVLIKKLTHNNEKVRIASAETLSIFRPNISEILVSKLKSNELSIENREIIWLLGKIGKKEDIAFLNNLKGQLEITNHNEELVKTINNAIKEITLRFVDLWFEKKGDKKKKS